MGCRLTTGILDPHVTCGWMAKFVNYHIYEGLVEIDLQKSRLADQAERPAGAILGHFR